MSRKLCSEGIARHIKGGPRILILVFLFGCGSLDKISESPLKNHPDFFYVRPDEEHKPLRDSHNGTVHQKLEEFWQYALLASAEYEIEDYYNGAIPQLCSERSVYTEKWKRVPELSSEVTLFGRQSQRSAGLAYSIWQDRTASADTRVAIVFRGSDRGDASDWWSNFRYVTRYVPFVSDQYELTRTLLPGLVSALKSQFGTDVEIVTVGHSLGGGLAQHAGMISSDISTVFAFSSSPVTGNFGYTDPSTASSRAGLTIFQISETGEVLSAGRWAHRQLFATDGTDPRIFELLFSFFRGRGSGGGTEDTISQHRSTLLTCQLVCRLEKGRSHSDCTAER